MNETVDTTERDVAAKRRVRRWIWWTVGIVVAWSAIDAGLAALDDNSPLTPSECSAAQSRFNAAESRGDPGAMRSADNRMRDGSCY